MFIFSIKLTKKRLIFCISVLLLIVLAVFLTILRKNHSNDSINHRYNINATSNSERIQFLSQFGWEVKDEPIEIVEAVIPNQFNDVYNKYNDIQIGQGFDLSKHKGKSCKKYVYEVKNYPGMSKGIQANLLVIDGKIIGGDISAKEINGLMHGFENPNAVQKSYETANIAKVLTEKTIQTTERETLAPDPRMPDAPTD